MRRWHVGFEGKTRPFAFAVGWPADVERLISFALTEKTFVNGFSFRGVPIVALRDFEDFFDGQILFNVSLGKVAACPEGSSRRPSRVAGQRPRSSKRI
ncbi:hypothetical protein [Bradyrhizobium pachyrhizi]|uniref:hypothetical protein n=1 Tax=Bradyrhizobium pachyrhizi TaxID=280333 RepID=UPI00067CDA03|nr:hypothetical protein [Bradyrhizobium pachyrhizi]